MTRFYNVHTVKPVLSHSKRTPKMVFNINYCLMQVKSIAECSNDFKTFVMSIFVWPLKTGFTVPWSLKLKESIMSKIF